jgi:hypothetical protein
MSACRLSGSKSKAGSGGNEPLRGSGESARRLSAAAAQGSGRLGTFGAVRMCGEEGEFLLVYPTRTLPRYVLTGVCAFCTAAQVPP